MLRQRIPLVIAILAAASIQVPADGQTPIMSHVPTKRILTIAHRGDHTAAPENSRAAFRCAIELGCDYVEMDVRQTKDHALVIMHDSTVDRTTDGTGAVAELTLARIRELTIRGQSGEHVPTFDEALDLCASKIGVYVDHKSGPPADVLAAIDRHGMLKYVAVYGSEDALREFKRLRPNVRIMCDHPRSAERIGELLRGLKPEILDGHLLAWSLGQVEAAHQGGAQVWADALGPLDGEILYTHAAHLGVDAIQTDHPEALLRWLKQTGRR